MAMEDQSVQKNNQSPVPSDKPSQRPSFKGLIPGLIIILVLAVLAGFGGAYAYAKFFSHNTSASVSESKNYVINEDTAVIDVAKNTSPSVVSITSSSNQTDFFGQQETQTAAGTGIIVSPDGLILTNKHVVEDGDSFSVITSDGKEYKDVSVVAKDPSNDIAFLKAKASGLKAATLGDSSKVQVGQRVIAIGNALGKFQNTVTTGVISGKGVSITASGGGSNEALQGLFQTDAAINPGNSGGPLVNIDGQVIGINTAVAGQAQNIGFAIPINDAKNDVESVKANGKITRPYLGVQYIMLTPEIATANDLSSSQGAYLRGSDMTTSAVLPGSPGAKAGLKNGDIIIKVNDSAVDKDSNLSQVIGQYKVGDTVKITIMRDGHQQTVTAKLEAAPSSN